MLRHMQRFIMDVFYRESRLVGSIDCRHQQWRMRFAHDGHECDHVDQEHGEVEKGHHERVRFDLPDWLV